MLAPMAAGRNWVRRAVGIDENGVGDLLDLRVALGRMGGPARDAVSQRVRECGRGRWGGCEKIQRVYSAPGWSGVLLSLIQSMAVKTTRG